MDGNFTNAIKREKPINIKKLVPNVDENARAVVFSELLPFTLLYSK